MPRTLRYVRDAAALSLDGLPPSYVVKPNHMSGAVILVRDRVDLATGAPVRQKRVLEKAAGWLATVYTHGLENGEGWYKSVPPVVLVEEFVDDDGGTAPLDYKFHTVHGRVAFISVDYGYMGNYTQQLFDARWRRLSFTKSLPDARHVPSTPRPARLAEMLAAAEALAGAFAFLRVDLYVARGVLYFSELTLAPNGGRAGLFDPPHIDNVLGFLMAHPGMSPDGVLYRAAKAIGAEDSAGR